MTDSEPRAGGCRPEGDRPRDLVVYALAILGWAALGLWYKPILSMFISPVWMILLVVLIPRWLTSWRRR